MDFSALTDDQTALIGCAAALFVCGGLLWLSAHVGRFFNRERAPARLTEHTEAAGARREALRAQAAPLESGRRAA